MTSVNPSNTATRSASQQPTVPSTAQQPTVPSTAQQPTVPATTAQQPTVSSTAAQQPTVPSTAAQQPTVPLTTQQSFDQQPTVSTNVAQQPTGVGGVSVPQVPCFGRGQGRGRGFTSGGPGLFEVSPEGEILHEGIPQSKELEHLAQLKEIASEHARQESLGAYGIPKGSAASLARIKETGIPPLSVQGMVAPADTVNEDELVKELKEEAEQRRIYESTHMGRVPVVGPANKVAEAAEKLEHVVKINKGEEISPIAQYRKPIIANNNRSRAIITTSISEQGELLHEGVAHSKELDHLAQLKEVAAEHAKREGTVAGVPRGSTTSVAQSAMGKYATALSEEIGVPALTVQGMVSRTGRPVDERKLAEELKEEAQQRADYEMKFFGSVSSTGPAAKVEEAAEKLAQVLKIDDVQVPTSVPDQPITDTSSGRPQEKTDSSSQQSVQRSISASRTTADEPQINE
ncbi:22306_t:CDS:2 [Dentiscutata erythropus]|uniref:22306_t:CDS:1 n=1 Tax=Dentiscutata erythropus TaxID=1348616 RepID=A0A9N9N2M6_9GLOM|nr:22306_t:CDS:2 [Dentiscutata erythropus]